MRGCYQRGGRALHVCGRDLVSDVRVQGSGFRVQGSGFRVQDSGFRVQGAGFRIQGFEFWAQVQGLSVYGVCSIFQI